jgi:hypothetical protein
MRVDPKFASAPLTSAAAPRPASGQRFSLNGTGASAKASGVASAMPLSSLDALLAVQGEGDAAERRRRSVTRGRNLLDSLDRLKAGLLSGRISGSQLQRLASELAGQRQGSGDAGLDEVIAHIELRAQVELAKLGRAHG